jgi:CBS domain-containing protein
VMMTDFRALRPDDPLSTAVEHILAGWQQDFPVVEDGHVLGVLTRDDLLKALPQRGSAVPVHEVMRRDFQMSDSHDMLEHALGLLRDCECRSLPVLHGGQLVGMLTMDNVGEFLTIEAALRRARKLARQT